MAEAGGSSAAGCATPERARAEDAVSSRPAPPASSPGSRPHASAHTRDTLHMHSVAGTVMRRVHGSQKSAIGSGSSRPTVGL